MYCKVHIPNVTAPFHMWSYFVLGGVLLCISLTSLDLKISMVFVSFGIICFRLGLIEKPFCNILNSNRWISSQLHLSKIKILWPNILVIFHEILAYAVYVCSTCLDELDLSSQPWNSIMQWYVFLDVWFHVQKQ